MASKMLTKLTSVIFSPKASTPRCADDQYIACGYLGYAVFRDQVLRLCAFTCPGGAKQYDPHDDYVLLPLILTPFMKPS